MSLSKIRLCSALALALSAWAMPALAADVSIVATPDPVLQGSGVDLKLMISGVTDLYGYNFSLLFDPSLLQVTSVTEGSFLATGGTTVFDGGTLDNTSGMISFAYDLLTGPVAGVSGAGTLVTIHMNAIGAGTSALSFVAADTTFVDSSGGIITVQAIDRTLAVTAVPEPSSYLLLAAGLAGIGAWRRRQANA